MNNAATIHTEPNFADFRSRIRLPMRRHKDFKFMNKQLQSIHTWVVQNSFFKKRIIPKDNIIKFLIVLNVYVFVCC